jgi:hypothetical protein
MTSTIITMGPLGPPTTSLATLHSIPLMKALSSVLSKPHSTVYIKLSMLQKDEIVGQTPLKDLDQIQLVLTRMPAKALYQFQVSVNHEIQSRAHKNMVEIKQATKKQETLEIVCA